MTDQFQSYSQLLMLYFNTLLPTSMTVKFSSLLISRGRVWSLLPFKNRTSNFVMCCRFSVGIAEMVFPLR